MKHSNVLLQAVAKTVLLARAADLEIDDLLELLGAGLTIADVLEIIMLRLSSKASPCVPGEDLQLVKYRLMVC